MNPPDIDARGLECPKPVLKTKEMLSETSKSFTILVDNEAARDNVSRFAASEGCTVDITEAGDCYLLSITPLVNPCNVAETVKPEMKQEKKKVVFISSDEIGRGEAELGKILVKSFLYACTESEETPSNIVLMNSGVKLATENEETIEHLQSLEKDGVGILICGTCLDFYGLKEKLRAGRISNMYEIQSILIGADLLICL